VWGRGEPARLPDWPWKRKSIFPASRNGEQRAGDHFGAVVDQPGYRFADFLRHHRPAVRNLRSHRLPLLGADVLIFGQAGTDRIDPYLILCQRRRQAFGQGRDAGFGGRVARRHRPGLDVVDTGKREIDDLAPALPQWVQRIMAGMKTSVQVQVDIGQPLLGRDVQNVFVNIGADHVD
jgi:hypothetical protein